VTKAALGALIVLTAAACGTNETDTSGRVERCIDRLLSNARDASAAAGEEARAYVGRTYCEPFAGKGWVYADGALAIDAQRWIDEGASCAVGSEDAPTRTVPCGEVDDPARADCAVLRHVRRDEVRAYVEERGGEKRFACEDGTPVAELGVP
jgi:hypothetical protein